jgi:transcriptional regulator with XRE-family HTH domain
MCAKVKQIYAFGVALRAYRMNRGLTQEQLGVRVNVVRSYICTLESGKKQPSLNMLLRIAAALDVTPGQLMDTMVAAIDGTGVMRA